MRDPGKPLNSWALLQVDDWMVDADCATRPDLPWTGDPEYLSRAELAAMRDVCRACPVALHCLAYVLTADVSGGVWAGKDRTNPAHADPPVLTGVEQAAARREVRGVA